MRSSVGYAANGSAPPLVTVVDAGPKLQSGDWLRCCGAPVKPAIRGFGIVELD